MMRILYQPHEYSQQRQRDKKAWVYPVLLAMQAEQHREHGHDVYWQTTNVKVDKVITEPENMDFKSLPHPDRLFTHAFSKQYQQYGNYKYHPATHMMAALDCWYAKCTFCDWAKKYPKVETRAVGDVIYEIQECARLGFNEIFDDSGTFPIGDWLQIFCREMRNQKRVTLGCNMRVIPDLDFYAMKEAGFRMVLFGVESFNQTTLARLNKGIKVEDIIPCFEKASKCGLEPHAALMTGYPWESYKEEMHTIENVKWLLKKGYAKTAQASVFSVPEHPTKDKNLKNKIYDVAYSPTFWINKLRDIKRWQDFAYLLKGIKKGVTRG